MFRNWAETKFLRTSPLVEESSFFPGGLRSGCGRADPGGYCRWKFASNSKGDGFKLLRLAACSVLASSFRLKPLGDLQPQGRASCTHRLHGFCCPWKGSQRDLRFRHRSQDRAERRCLDSGGEFGWFMGRKETCWLARLSLSSSVVLFLSRWMISLVDDRETEWL